MDKRIIVPRIVVRPILPPPLEIGARIRPQWLHWQVGRYREKLSFGPGGKGKAKIWVPEREGEQHNLILTQFYDTLIPTYGFIGPSQFAAVGTGSTAPDPSQTQLANEIGTSSSPRRTNSVPSGESNAIEVLATHGEYNIRRVLEFTEAQVGGLNLTEWGFSPVSSRNGPLMTRELFRDGSGNPIVLTLAMDQRLRLVYRYKVALSPTSPQDVSVNVGGDGPGVRTAKFLLTGRFENYNVSHTYSGIALPTSAQDRMGDLLVAEVLAKGSLIGTYPIGHLVLSSNAAPLQYIHSINDIGGTANPFYKQLTFDPPSGRSRRASALAQTNEFLMTIRSAVLMGGMRTWPYPPTVNLVFDAGQGFTKDNLHKLFIGYWQITWGP
jgi:hypothetical protein